MKHSRGGFTLLEVLVAAAIMSVVVTIAMKLCIDFLDAWGKSAEKMTLYKEARFILDRIEEDFEGSIVQWSAGFDNFEKSEKNESNDFLKKRVLVLRKPRKEGAFEEIKYYLGKDQEKDRFLLYRMEALIGDTVKEFKMRLRYRDASGNLQWANKAPVNGELVYADISIAVQANKANIQKFERRVLLSN